MEWIPLKKKISNLKPQVSFYLKFASLFNDIGDKSSVLFWLKLYLIFNLIIFSAKVQNFRLSTVQVKFHQICTLIGYFCWSYIKFQLKKHGGVMSHDIKEWYKIWSVTDFFFSKMTQIWWILIRALKSLKNLHFDSSLCAKYTTFDLKKIQRSIFHDTDESCKIWRKTDL